MRCVTIAALLTLPLAAYAGNVKDTDLIASNTFFLPPSTAKTVFIQARNSSDNQGVSLTDLGSRLTAKGYQIIPDPSAAHYIVLANIVYCNVTKPEMPVENIVAGGYGAGIGSSLMGGLHSLSGLAGMAGPHGAMAGAAASMGLSAIEGVSGAIGGMLGGSAAPNMPDDVNYACVADLQITEQGTAASAPASAKSETGPPPGVYQTRLAADVHQKKLDEVEATPLLQQRLSAAVAGNF